ncbi:MAG: hypothetical protein M2R45_04138 [Verrucomicrobia subdivision 3 bacterium]|nr:hypothetical protein [Limisphaerales bacterium]MCS1417680.1 hypothetical protein [Limisphaerales bacterium]
MNSKRQSKPKAQPSVLKARLQIPGNGYRVNTVFNRFSLSWIDRFLIIEVAFVDNVPAVKRNREIWGQHAFVIQSTDLNDDLDSLEQYLQSLDPIETNPNACVDDLPRPEYRNFPSFNRIFAGFEGSSSELVLLNIVKAQASQTMREKEKSSPVVIEPEGVAVLRSDSNVQKALILEIITKAQELNL